MAKMIVKVRKDLEVGEVVSGDTIYEEMSNLFGKEYEVLETKGVKPEGFWTIAYRLKGKGGDYFWNKDMFEYIK